MYIGHIPGVGAAALTGVGVTMPVIMAITAFAYFISMGGAPRSSIMMGRNEKEKAEKILGNCTTMLVEMCIRDRNKNFAKYSGIGVTGTILLSQIIGGAIAGLGGAAYMMGSQQRFNWEWRSGYGWDGLIIAIIARNNPKFVPVGAFLLAYLRIGSDIMSRGTDVQNEVVSIIQGVIIILIAATGFLARCV